MGLTEQEVLDINAGWRNTTATAMQAIAKGGGWVWQMMSGLSMPAGTGDKCASQLREQCTQQNTRMTYSSFGLESSHAPGSIKDAASDVARFLLVRGPYAYLGTSWVGCEPDNGVEGDYILYLKRWIFH